MTDSLAALLAGAIDYAGMYPPASLSLEQSVENYRRYRASPEAWMLGRFACPAARLADLAEMGWSERDGLLAVIAPGGDTALLLLKTLGEALPPNRESPIVRAIDTVEFRWPAELSRARDVWQNQTVIVGTAGRLDKLHEPGILPPLTIFIEFAPVNLRFPDVVWHKALNECITSLATADQIGKDKQYRAGFKFRTGGTEASAVPTSAELSAVICACRERGVFWKATAGLHHAFRHFDPALGTTVHGFVNVLAAAVLADRYVLDEPTTQEILDDEDPGNFNIDGGTLAWRFYSITSEQIAAARQRSLRSFGSCSFDEPCEDLVTLCKRNRS